MLWELPILTTVCIVVTSLWWFCNRQTASPRSLCTLAVAATLAFAIDSRRTALQLCGFAYGAALDATPTQQFEMVLAIGAVVWLLHRSWQTLWKPVPELVRILGVDIPQAPDVCLAGIGLDSATLSWTKTASNRPVQKYMIHVNGVHVGDSPGNETAITVTGLRPNHFYNLRVVAVGPNSFRAGSPYIRLRTFGKDGRPQLRDSRLPTSFVDPDLSRCQGGDDNNRSDKSISSLPAVEAAPVLNSGAAIPRDPTIAPPGQRRNTLNRRHSPSVESTDQSQTKVAMSADSELSLAKLNEKFEGIRKKIDDALALYAKDETDSQHQGEELKMDRDRKRQALKEKEEQTAQLKTSLRITMEQMRAAEKERGKKQQLLKDRNTKRAKALDSVAKSENEVERMKNARQGFETHKGELAQIQDCNVHRLDGDNAELQSNCVKLEAELKDKGKQLQDLKASRAPLSVADDEKWKEDDLTMKRKWELAKREMHGRLVTETKDAHTLVQKIRELNEQLSVQQHAGHAFYNQTGSSAMDFEPPLISQPNRPSQCANTLLRAGLSPDRSPLAKSSFLGGIGFTNAGYPPGLFTNAAADSSKEVLADIGFRETGGLWSTSAQTLLPSNIFEESEETDTMDSRRPFRPRTKPASEGPRSPASTDMFSSPHGSAHNLPFPQHSAKSEDKSFNAHSSPSQASGTGHKIASLLSTFQRGRGTKTPDSAGPPIGSLKPGQSQSFPTVSDENEILATRRSINFSAWVSRESMTPDMASPGQSIVAPRPLSALRMNPYKGTPAMGVSERESEHSRPASIASTDLPQPSTDSGSIWGAPGDTLVLQKNRLWSLGDGRWPSRHVSRRPSLQGSNALTTTLASADDEILDEDDLMNPETLPSQVGVIGSRPPGTSKSMNQRLNPAAPTFMAHIFRKDRDRSKDKGKGREVPTPSEDPPRNPEDSPPGSRASRDTHSVYTQTSVSESHESLQLDVTPSNTTSDVNSLSAFNAKDPEKVVRKLFRKGSSSKFSLSSRLGSLESGLFKKGSGSARNSDRNAPTDRRSSIGDADDLGEDVAVLGRSYDSGTSSTSLGPARSKENWEGGRMSSWCFSMSSIKKGKEAPVKEKGGPETDQVADGGSSSRRF